MSLILVTGGAGFIGSHLVETLVARGDKVRAFDNFSTGRMNNLARVQEKIEIITGDLNNREALVQAARGTRLRRARNDRGDGGTSPDGPSTDVRNAAYDYGDFKR